MLTFSPLFLKGKSGVGAFVPPIYNLTESIIFANNYYWVVNSANGLTTGHGKLCKADGSTWSSAEVAARYTPEEGLLDLSSGYYIDTAWEPVESESWNISAIYNVIIGTSYSIYTIRYKGSNIADIYLYNSSEESFPVVPTYTDITFSAPAGVWKIYEEPPVGVLYPAEIEYTMGVFNII